MYPRSRNIKRYNDRSVRAYAGTMSMHPRVFAPRMHLQMHAVAPHRLDSTQSRASARRRRHEMHAAALCSAGLHAPACVWVASAVRNARACVSSAATARNRVHLGCSIVGKCTRVRVVCRNCTQPRASATRRRHETYVHAGIVAQPHAMACARLQCRGRGSGRSRAFRWQA